MASLAKAVVCDTNAALLSSGDLRNLQPIFQRYGQCRASSGAVVTLKVFKDNLLVWELLETRGAGRVLVRDGGGSMRCALVGGNLGQLAQNMGWAGIVVNGCIRDVDEINACDIGISIGIASPEIEQKRDRGEKNLLVHIAGTFILCLMLNHDFTIVVMHLDYCIFYSVEDGEIKWIVLYSAQFSFIKLLK